VVVVLVAGVVVELDVVVVVVLGVVVEVVVELVVGEVVVVGVVVVELVVGTVVLVAVFKGRLQSCADSAPTVLTPWIRFARSVALIAGGRSATALPSAAIASDASPQWWAATAAETASS
jgi:hypothetical protein